MADHPGKIPTHRKFSLCLLSWFIMLGIDFFLHAGVFADLYIQSSPSLLAPEDAFRLIPVGYAAILIQVILLIWLLIRLGIQTWKEGALFGGKLGFLLGGSMVLGLFSISTLRWEFLAAWMVAGIVELAAAGAVMGAGLRAERMKPLTIRVGFVFTLLLIFTIVMQSIE